MRKTYRVTLVHERTTRITNLEVSATSVPEAATTARVAIGNATRQWAVLDVQEVAK